jgi:hypothetical protein
MPLKSSQHPQHFATTPLSKPILFVRKTHGLSFGIDVQLFVNICNVFPDSKGTDVDDGGDSFGIPAVNHVFENFFFAFGNAFQRSGSAPNRAGFSAA